jgi:anti-sigma regulatory factor (Ser/Thr protein kinase)
MLASAGFRVQEDAAMRGFRHEALLYRGRQEFLDGTLSFIEGAVAAGEPILVAVSAEKIVRLRERLNGASDRVAFADMSALGANPARIIPAWHDFVAEHGTRGGAVRGIGEPIWAERTATELVECQRHESLLNLAFADAEDFTLLCPYDEDALDAAVIAEACRSHPLLVEDGVERVSDECRTLEAVAAPFDAPLAEPDGPVAELAFDALTLPRVRGFVASHAAATGLGARRIADLAFSVNEVASNSVRHGGGAGTVRIWSTGNGVICEVRDGGRFDNPLAGRQRPVGDQVGGWGLWLANQLCELVEVRSLPEATAVRLHVSK